MTSSSLQTAARWLVAFAMLIPSLGSVTAARGADWTVTREPCARAVPSPVEYRYTILGRIRPFLIWLGRHEVGTARLAIRDVGVDARQIELLIGTDPERAPMGINRWGYIAETVCGARATLVGVMTQSDEETVEQARTAETTKGRTHPYQAIHTTIDHGEARSEVVRLAAATNFSYRDLNLVVAALPANGTVKRVTVPPGTESGFLTALRELLRDAAEQHRTSGRPPRNIRRTYLHNAGMYALTLGDSKALADLRVQGRVYGRPIESEVENKNLTTRTTTDFRITYSASGPDFGVPFRVVYRPRWWLEVELLRDAQDRDY